MSEKETIFSSKISYNGIFSFKDFYSFCYSWLKEEMSLELQETKYSEKIEGPMKKIGISWAGNKKMTDYFKFEAGIEVSASIKEVEINEGNAKLKTNQGSVEVSIKGTLVRDYEGKFETTAFNKFLRSIYEKWVIASTIEDYRAKVSGACDSFLNQTKAYLDLEAKK